MKLDWKRAGCASIAECGEMTAVVLYDDSKVEHRWQVFRRSGFLLQAATVRSNDFSDAEVEVIAILEQHDRPEWHDVTDWLSWAEWRGRQLHCYWGGDVLGFVGRCVFGVRNDCCGMMSSMESAKAAAEKWVREQGN